MRDKNVDTIVETLCSMPFVGAVLDREPYPIGEVVSADDVPVTAKRLAVRLQDRAVGEVEVREVVVLYVDDQPVMISPAAKEDDDGG